MSSITPVSTPVVLAAPSSANPVTAGAVASSNSSSGLTSASVISSLADLKKKSPKLYNKMMQGIAMSICNEMKDHQERLKKMMREGQQ